MSNSFLVQVRLLLIFTCWSGTVHSQKSTLPYYNPKQGVAPGAVSHTVSVNDRYFFIEQAGQYKPAAGLDHLGKVYGGFEGFSAPVLFTGRGLIFLQKKESRLSHHEEEQLEKQGIPEEEIERRRNVVTSTVTMEWVGANPNPEVLLLDKTHDYHTYGSMPGKAYGYGRILYKNIYPGIDIIYSINAESGKGFEYSLVVHPGADPSIVRMKYGGDVTKIKVDKNNNLVIKSHVDEMVQSVPVSFTTEDPALWRATPTTSLIETGFSVQDNEIHFLVKGEYDHSKVLVIDPFVSSSASLTGVNAGIAKDVDFDYAGNVYVSGGGDGNVYQMAKYDATGVLQWTFSGTVNNPQWSFGPYFGGWVVEKTTGNIYLGQGFDFLTGFIVVRISTTGLYDNYITTGNPNFRENWKMIWNCNNGLPQIIVAGGGTNSNINLGLLSPPSVVPTAINITGIASIAFQDMADMVIDPLTNSMYTIYASGSVPTLNNSIYKHDQPYSAATRAWSAPTGYSVLQEAANRPYLGIGLNDNSANLLAVNPSYLFYWDGRNLKALDKATGAVVGTPITTGNTALMQGGIIADACNNVFVGDVNGTIKVYNFNGTVFNDAAVPDISIPGFATKPVFDLAYNETQKLLYASGNGFVTAIDVSAYCPNTVYALNITTNCVTSGVSAVLNPAPPAGSTVTYALFTGTTQIGSNTTGAFNTLSSGVTYTITATINQACSGTQSTTTFLMPGPTVATIKTDASCGASSGSITATGSGTTGPYTYSIDGTNFFAGGTFNSLTGGVYTVTVKDGSGCISTTQVTIINTDGPLLTFSQTNAECGNGNATVTAAATGGTTPYQYSINGGVTYQNSSFFTALLAGQYTLMVKDGAGCTNASPVTITSSTSPGIIAIPAAATCGGNNGLINAFGSSGTAPYQYSINGNTFQPTNTFANLAPGTYTVTVKDANGCSQSTTSIISNTPAPTVTATATQAACANSNGSITATGSGGLAPLQYSINNGPFQPGNVFPGLLGGTYTISVQDIAGCIGSTNVAVTSVSSGPVVTASAIASACNVNNGTIAAFASGGLAPYQYSINNTTYQAGTNFSGLAPGNYVVFAKDNAGCINTFSIVVPPTSGPTLTVAVTASSCLVNDGTIVITASGGTGALTYSIDGVNFVAGSSFTGLAPGIYTATVKDANGCSRSKTVTVANASGLTLAMAALASSCSGNSGSVTATATGGIAPLEYSINGVTYQSSNIFYSLAPGSYTIYVKDANGCVIDKTAVVTSVASPTLTVSSINATCATASGAVRAFGAGGVAPLTYNIDGGAFTSTNAFVNLATGVHIVLVKDAGGCTASQSVTITNNTAANPPPTDITYTVRNAFPCTGGVVKIKNLKGFPSGGGNNYDFSLDFGPFDNANTFTGVAPGVHVITAINDDGCTYSEIVTIGTGIPATANATAVGTACGTTNGSITINGVGGSTPYHASIDGSTVWQTFFPPGANSFTFNNLAPGTHTITMADDADFTAGTPDIPGACLTSILVTVPTIGGPSVATTKFDGTCALNNGTITATGTGIAPLTFNINGNAYQASGDFINLASGLYTINMKDGNGCISSTTVTITNPSGPVISATTVSTSCNLSNGSITASSTNGVGAVQYSIDGFTFQSSGNFTNLAPGTYNLYAKDANGCYSSLPVPVTANPVPRVTAFTIAASCGNNDGSIFVTATSGTAPYQFSLDGVVYQSSTTFSGLGAGIYTVTIKDARGCTNTTTITLSNIGAPTFANTNAINACGNSNGTTTITATGGTAPYLYSSDGVNFGASNTITGLAAGSNVITVKDFNGCITPKLIVVTNAPGPQTLTAVVSDASCGLGNGTITAASSGGVAPLQYSKDGVVFQPGNNFSGVSAGNYTLYVRDANLCLKTLPVVVANLAGPSVSGILPSAATCVINDGTITATVSGGTGTLTFSINASPFQASNIFTGLAAGTYSVTAKDIKGCSVTVNNIVVPALSNIAVSETHTTASCAGNDASITATGSAGATPYQYSIDGTNFQLSNIFNSLGAGNFTLTVKDANGCTANTPVTIISPSLPGIKTWLGVNTDWQDPVNWCGGVPVITDNVLIPTGRVNYPGITTGTGYAKNLTIQPGASVVVTTAVQVADTIKNLGTLDAVHGTVELIGSTKQSIAGSIFLDHIIHHLIISNTSAGGVEVAATAGDTLKISRKLSFNFDDAVLTTGNNITLLSSDSATASVGVIKENPDGTPRVTINGTMVVERYYPRKRAWRLITAPVKTDVATPSINTAWQEGANPPSVTGVSNPDPHPGYGTHITGPYAAVTAYTPSVTASGFDQSPQNNSSLKYFDRITGTYKPVTNTYTTKVTDKQGFLVFVRGDRSYDISTTTNTVNPSSSILRVQGNVNTGLISIPADTGIQVIGNPYPSAIRFGDSMFTHNAAILKNASFWLWDPLRGAARNSPSNVGGWIPVVYAGNGIYTSTYDPSQSVAGLDSAHTFDIDGTIQSGAAFIIDNKATATGNFVIHESNKIDGSNNSLFRPAGSNISSLTTNLFRTDDANKPLYWADGAMILLDENYHQQPDWNEDVRKIFSSGENLAIRHDDNKIAIEKRKTIQASDTIFYDVNRLKPGKYRFELFFKNLTGLGMAAFFEDAYSGNQRLLSFTDHNLIDVDVTADSSSLMANRFRIIFKPLTILPVMQLHFNAWENEEKVSVEWNVDHEQGIGKYVVERSCNGKDFTSLQTVTSHSAGTLTTNYRITDMHPVPGDNFYRLRMIKQDGTYSYSPTVLVTMVPGVSYIQVSPNPVQNGKIQLVLKQVVKGKYRYELYNAAGQMMHKGQLIHEGGSKAYHLLPYEKLMPGVYKLAITGTGVKRTILSVIVLE